MRFTLSLPTHTFFLLLKGSDRQTNKNAMGGYINMGHEIPQYDVVRVPCAAFSF